MFDIQTLDDVKQWIAGHRAESDLNWTNQKAWNLTFDNKVTEHEKRITSIEKKIALITFSAAAVGSFLGNLF